MFILYFVGRFFILPVALGMLLSLAALLPPLRTWGKGNLTRQFITPVVVMLIAVPIFKLQAAYELTSERFNVGLLTNAALRAAPPGVKDSVFREIWLRLVVPPSLKQICYTQTGVCSLADQVVYRYTNGRTNDLSVYEESWLEYLLFPLILAVPTVMGSILATLFLALLDEQLFPRSTQV